MVTHFKFLFMHSLSKVSQINKRHCISSIHKQAPSRNFSCPVVCFPSLHCSWPTQSQSAPLCLQQKRLNKEIPGPKLFKRFSACTSGPVNFQKLCFWRLKLRRAGMNTTLGTGGLRENDSDWREKASSREALKWGEEDLSSLRWSTIRNICWRKSQIWCLKGTQHVHLCQSPIPEVTN